MVAKYNRNVSCKITKDLENSLKKEAKSKGLDYGQYIRSILENRNELVDVDFDGINENEPLYRVSVTVFTQNSIETIIRNYKSMKEGLCYDGDVWMEMELKGIEKINFNGDVDG